MIHCVCVWCTAGHRRWSGWARTRTADVGRTRTARVGRVIQRRRLAQPVFCCLNTDCWLQMRTTPVVTRLYCCVQRRRLVGLQTASSSVRDIWYSFARWRSTVVIFVGLYRLYSVCVCVCDCELAWLNPTMTLAVLLPTTLLRRCP